MIHDWKVEHNTGRSSPNPQSTEFKGPSCPNRFIGCVSYPNAITIVTIKNIYRSFQYLLSNLVESSNRRIKTMKIAAVIVLFPIIIMPLLILAIIKNLSDFTYFPLQQRFLPRRDGSLKMPPGGEPIHLTTANSDLVGYDYPRSDKNTSCKGIIVYFPGNGLTAERSAINTAGAWQAQGFRCLFASYPGYGRSSGRILSEEDVYTAGQAFVDYAMQLPRDADCPLILMGYSIGSGIAMHLAAKNANSIDKVILQAPYFSLRSVTEEWIPKLLTCLIRPTIYNIPTYQNIINFTQASANKKVLIMHAVNDEVIPYRESIKLLDHYLKLNSVNNSSQVALLTFIPSDDNPNCPDFECQDNHKYHAQPWHSYLPRKYCSFILDKQWSWNNN